MQARWFFMTHPNFSWFDDLSRSLSSPDVRIWSEDNDGVAEWYGWESRHLDDATSPQQFADRLAALKAVFDGAMFLWKGASYDPIMLERPKAYDPDDFQFVAHLPALADVRAKPFSQAMINRNVAKDDYPFSHQVSHMIFHARYDSVVCAILKYIGVQRFTYFTIYALYDWMKVKPAGTDAQVAQKAGWSQTQLKDFKNTANNPAYLGPFCRHGGVVCAPKRPMPLDEAVGPIRKAVGAFIEERAAISTLQAKWTAIVSN